MVLSRYRIIFVPVLVPFAALTISDLLGTWKGGKNYLILIALLILGYFAATPGSEKVSKLSKNDYAGIWSVHYATAIKNSLDYKQWDKVAPALSDFLQKYEPEKIANVQPSYRCEDSNEVEIFNYFAMMHSNLALVYNNNNDANNAASQREISEKLKNIATRQPRIH
jgi:hypothetical protein